MKTKIFIAFLIVILCSLLTSLIFELLIIEDFDDYVKGVKEDQFYWVLASIEGSYSNGWDKKALSEPIHWAMMLGLDIKVLDSEGREVISSKEVMDSLSGTMQQRMKGLLHIHMAEGEYDKYPLFYNGKNIGTLLSRPFQKDILREKESIFKKRARNFVIISFIIAGTGSLVIAMLLSRYLSKPLTELKSAAESITRGNFDVSLKLKTKDDVGKLSESFHIMVESLKKEEKLRKHLMSNIAHELRTPLTIAKSNIEAIEDGIISPEKGIYNLKGEIERLIRLVNGIEDLTTAEASFFVRGSMEEFNLKDFLIDMIDELMPAFKEKDLQISILKNEDIRVFSDIEKLEKIVRNIISNSLKFTEKGGIWIDYGIVENYFYIEIKDSGIGISEKEIPLIFDRFYRAEGVKAPGLGLGLAIVKELVDIMGGKIEVRSEVGKGSIFRVYLPREIKK